MKSLKPGPRALQVKAEKGNIFFNLPIYSPDLASKQKEDTYKLGRPICNP
jgi:hypothetical protein